MANHISYETKIKRKRGQGEGKTYKPWYQVGEKNAGHTSNGQKSRGNGHRLKGLKTKRIHHLLSDFEKLLFITFDLNSEISDIREQYPLLDIALARKISKELGVKYPSHSENHILTSDFLITYKDGHKEVITFKPLSDINKRQLELFQIEKTYWAKKQLPWKLMTDKEIPRDKTLLKNYIDIYYSVVLFHNKDFSITQVREFYSNLLDSYKNDESLGIVEYCVISDQDLNYQDGLSLRIFKLLIGKQIIKVDLSRNVFSNQEIISSVKLLKDVKYIDKSALAA